MALADYFSKDALAISQVLNQGSSKTFENILNSTVIGIGLDSTINKHEGQVTVDLLVRLLSRLYPKIRFIDLDGKCSETIERMRKLALSINSKIEIVSQEPATVAVVIGNTKMDQKLSQEPIFYLGSDHWNTLFSCTKPVGSGNSPLPFGPGVAACMGASNIFKYVFRSLISKGELDKEFNFSIINLCIADELPVIKSSEINLGDFLLIGVGAIGNGVIWALKNAPTIKGKINIIEPQDIELSNLQRYIITEERHNGWRKTLLAEEYLKDSSIEKSCFPTDWAGFLTEKKDWKQTTILVAVDSAKDRIAIQSSLPYEIFNGYTANGVLGISRHQNFGEDACLACGYIPSEKQKSHSQSVADNLGLSNQEVQIRVYLHYNSPVDEKLLRMVSEANKLEYNDLKKYEGKPISDFYHKAVCGGELLVLRTEEKAIEKLEAPLAFQSALAGILLIAELVLQKSRIRKEKIPNQTQIYPLKPFKKDINPYNHTIPKNKTGSCICLDPDFNSTYKQKWNIGQ